MDKANQHVIIAMLIDEFVLNKFVFVFQGQETRLFQCDRHFELLDWKYYTDNVVDKLSRNDSAYFSLLFWQ